MHLFGGHTINTIAETQWIKLPLRFPSVEQYTEPKVRIQDVCVIFFFFNFIGNLNFYLFYIVSY